MIRELVNSLKVKYGHKPCAIVTIDLSGNPIKLQVKITKIIAIRSRDNHEMIIL
jgi:hypothetical protein